MKRVPLAGALAIGALPAIRRSASERGRPTDMQSAFEEDWPKRLAGTLRPEDIPALRRVRRHRMTYLTDEALYDYPVLSAVLMTLTWGSASAK